MCLSQLGLDPDVTPGMARRVNQKYSIGESGQIEWRKSPSIDMYYMEDKDALAEYLAFQTRAVSSGLIAYGSTKGTVVRREG
eukprot:5825358-Pleurochrysis_carterae.AAC.1